MTSKAPRRTLPYEVHVPQGGCKKSEKGVLRVSGVGVQNKLNILRGGAKSRGSQISYDTGSFLIGSHYRDSQ